MKMKLEKEVELFELDAAYSDWLDSMFASYLEDCCHFGIEPLSFDEWKEEVIL